MRKILITTLLLLPFFVWSQSYIPIPADSTSEWRVKNVYHFKSNICLHIDDIKYYFIGDTLIDTFTYSKLYKSGVYYQEPIGPDANCDSVIYHFTDVLVGGIRNDAGKVYFKSIYNDPEILLYDFTLNIGDTLKRPYFVFDANIIVAIDTVTINNRQHRRFFIDSDTLSPATIDSTQYITEGIGSSTGLLKAANFESANDLLCYAENHIPIYPVGSSCILNVGINKIKDDNQKESVQLYPNPVKDIINLEFKNINHNDLELTIYNMMGKQVKQFQIPRGELKYMLNLSKLDAGLYFYKIWNETGIIYSGKIIKE